MSLRIEGPGVHKFKALQMSLAIHVAVLIILIGAGSSLKPADRLLVVDFRMEDSPDGGDRTFAASEVKFHKDIGQKAGTTKETQRKQKDQESTNQVQRQEVPFHTTPEILETSVSEKPQVLSQINPDATSAGSVKSVVISRGLNSIALGSAGSSDFSAGVKDTITTAYGGGSGGQSRLKGKYLRRNFSYIRDRIQKRIIYPPLARRMGWEGNVTVSFIIVSDGRVNEIKVKESSGKDVLDKSAVETIIAASPFPAPPIEAQIIIPILYRLN